MTEYFFQTLHRAFKKWNADVVADACADLHMGFDTDASIQAASRIHRLALFARWQKASCLIQTWTPEAFEPMSEIKTFLSQERSVRSEYHLPPLWTRITITSKTEISDTFDDLLATIQQSPDIHHVLRDQTLEIFVQPTQRGLLDRHLQELPDSCIIRVTYD